MGKKKDKERAEHEARMFNVGVLNKGHKAAIERYGIDLNDYSPHADHSDRVHGKKGYDELQKELLRRANSDYTTMRANEAAALSGNKDARKFAEKGIGSLADLTAMGKMQKKMHKDLGNGGAFTSASDFAGLSFANVEADRAKLMEDLKAKAEAATPEIAPEAPPEAQFTITEEEDSANTEERRKRIADYEAKRATGGFLGDTGSDYMDKYKFNVKKGLRDAGVDTRGPEAPSFIL